MSCRRVRNYELRERREATVYAEKESDSDWLETSSDDGDDDDGSDSSDEFGSDNEMLDPNM